MNAPSQQPLPVVYVLDASLAVTGAFVAAKHMAQALKGKAQLVLVLPRGSQIEATQTAGFLRVEYIPIVALSKRWRALVAYLPVLLLGTLRLRRLMLRDGARQLIVNDFYLMHGVLLSRSIRVSAWVRCDPKRFAGPLAKPMLWLLQRRCHHVVAVSQHVRQWLPARGEYTVLYDCYSRDAGQPKLFQPEDEKPLVYVGNYIRGKGQDVALRAFAIAAMQDATLRLAFYGGDMGLQKNRDYLAELKQLAQQLNIAHRVHFGDFIADNAAVLGPAYAALNFSVSESFSMTVLEAQGAAVPVIATNSGGPAEIIDDGVTGFIIPLGDVATAAQKMSLLAADVPLRNRMAQAAAQRVAQRFSRQEFAKALVPLLLAD